MQWALIGDYAVAKPDASVAHHSHGTMERLSKCSERPDKLLAVQ